MFLDLEEYRRQMAKRAKVKQEFLSQWEAEFRTYLATHGVTDRIFRTIENEAHLRYISGNEVGPIIEKAFIIGFDMEPTNKSKYGDCQKNGVQVEFKSTRDYSGSGIFRIRNIKPFRKIDIYTFFLMDGMLQQNYWICIPATVLHDIADQCGFMERSSNGTKYTREINSTWSYMFELDRSEEDIWSAFMQYQVSIADMQTIWSDPSLLTHRPIDMRQSFQLVEDALSA